MKKALLLVGLIIISATTADTMALVPAFPGAEGEGRWVTGGRDGTVYEVNNLTNSGPGSIVDALSEGNRTIVFRVSGTINLDGVILEPKSNTTIAGQTAPGDGICIKGRIHLTNFVHDIIIRYIRIRVDAGAMNSEGDAIDIDKCSNVIIDHVTASYSRDEGISCQENSDNITVQWCIISEGLNYQSHSYGSLIRGTLGQEKTYHHNLYAHNKNRNPRPGNYTNISSDTEGLHFDCRNNVMYNWDGRTAGANDDGPGFVSRYNFIGNVYIHGPNSTSVSYRQGFRERSKDAYGYFADNSYDGTVDDSWSIVHFDSGYMTPADITAYKARSYLVPMEPVTTTSPALAKTDVLADAGASFPKRDIVDTRIVTDVLNGTGYIINDTNEHWPPVGGWWPALICLPAPTDTDHDGMPNAWETSRSLNPSDAADSNGHNLDVNYTNLEVYLNDIMNSPSAPTGLTATTGYATVVLNWNDNSEINLAGYNVYRSTNPSTGYSKLNGSLLSDSNYIDNITTHDTVYYYVVTAVDTSSNEFSRSNRVLSGLYGDFTGNGMVEINDLPGLFDLWLEDDCDETAGLDLDENCIVNFYEFSVLAENRKYVLPDFIAPLSPTGLQTTGGNSTVSLDWNNNSEPDLAGYNVYRSTTFGGGYTKVNGSLVGDSNYVDHTVTNNTIYYYVVTAVDISPLESGYSNWASAIPLDAGSIVIQENTTGFCSVDGIIDSTFANYTGSGYAQTYAYDPDYGINWKISVPSNGIYTFKWRHAHGFGDRTARLLVNGSVVIPNISFPATGDGSIWSQVSVDVSLTTAGTKDIRLEATTDQGLSLIDYMMVTGDNPTAVTCP